MAGCLDRTLVDLEDVVNESNRVGNVTPVGALDEAHVTGVLAAIVKLELDGLGIYGLTIDKLQEAGVVKQGLNLTGTPEEILADPSVWTGCGAVRKVEDLLDSEAKQMAVVLAAAAKTLNKLTNLGVITGDETDEELAVIVGLATQYDAADIKEFLTGTPPDLPEDLLADMTDLSDASKYASDLVDSKASDILDQVNGLGASVSGLPDQVSGSVKLPDLDAEVDKFVGSARIPSSINPDEIEGTVTKAAGSLSIEDLF